MATCLRVINSLIQIDFVNDMASWAGLSNSSKRYSRRGVNTVQVHSRNLTELARQQLADYDRHCPGALFTAVENNPAAMTIEDAYRLQMEVAQLRRQRGEPVAGYKIGCVSPVMQAQLGLDRPVFGHIYATELNASGVELDP